MLALIWKDLVLEARRRETVPSLFALGVVTLLIFNFAIDIVPANAPRLAPGLLWVAIAFSATIGVTRTFLTERENGALTGLLLAPIDRGTIYLAKLGVNLIFLLAFEALLLPVVIMMFGLPVDLRLAELGVVLFGGTLGLAATGTLFALAALGTRARELLMPLVVLPLQVPLLIAAVKASAIVLRGDGLGALGAWGSLLIGFDVLFLTLGWLAFEFLTVD